MLTQVSVWRLWHISFALEIAPTIREPKSTSSVLNIFYTHITMHNLFHTAFGWNALFASCLPPSNGSLKYIFANGCSICLAEPGIPCIAAICIYYRKTNPCISRIASHLNHNQVIYLKSVCHFINAERLCYNDIDVYIYIVVCKEHYEKFRQVSKCVYYSHVWIITVTDVDIKDRIRIFHDIIKYAPILHKILTFTAWISIHTIALWGRNCPYMPATV